MICGNLGDDQHTPILCTRDPGHTGQHCATGRTGLVWWAAGVTPNPYPYGGRWAYMCDSPMCAGEVRGIGPECWCCGQPTWPINSPRPRTSAGA